MEISIEFISTLRSSHRRWSVKKDVRKDLVNFTGKHLLTRDPNTVVFLRNLQIFKNVYFEEHVRTAASER